MDKISVIIPVYNVQDYLPRCLDSVINNTYKNIEIICINDGSTDRSKEILEKYYQLDQRIKVYNQENKGISATRNRGLQIATGEYIAFIDSDDWVHTQYFELLINSIKSNSADIVICNYEHVSSYCKDKDVYQGAKVESIVNGIGMFQNHKGKSYVWGKLYKRELLKKCYFVEDTVCPEDTIFNADLMMNHPNMKVITIKESLYYYFIRPGSLVTMLGDKELLYLCSRYREYISKSNNIRINTILNKEIFKRALSIRYGQQIKKNNVHNLNESKKYIKSSYSDLCKKSNISTKERLIFFVFKNIPISYRIFRIVNDPTMLIWEKNCRTKRLL